MGLDITAYRTATLHKAITLKEWNAGACEEYDDGNREFLYSDHPSRTQHDGMPEGVYDVSDGFGFRAGSYGGYNQWRAWLASVIGKTDQEIWDRPEPGPFVELIHFSDCEGFMGPKTSAKLAKDFAEWRDRAVVHASAAQNAEWLVKKYDDWAKAFALAADSGVVKFY